MPKEIQIDYELLKKPQAVLNTTMLTVMAYLAFFYFHPTNQYWMDSPEFAWKNTLQFVLIDQMLIECITTSIVFLLLRVYANKSRLNTLTLAPKHFLIYELKFLPILLAAFFFFNPFTQTVRFLYHYGLSSDWAVYFDQYFYSQTLYITYLIPSLVSGYVIINVNIFSQLHKKLQETSTIVEKKNAVSQRVKAIDDWGEVFLLTSDIMWIEKEDRKYFAVTTKGKFKVRETIAELEVKMDANKFVRINRGVIVNLDYMLNYSFWENDKYILRMNDKNDSEFVMSRQRLNKIKERLEV